MTTRVLLLPAVIAGLFIIAGCYGTIEPPKAEQLPVAPEPRAKRKLNETEKALVGTWKLVKRTPHNPRGAQLTFEYKPDGTVTLWKNSQRYGLSLETGTYSVAGKTLFLSMPADPRQRDGTIALLTADKLVLTSGTEPSDLVHEYSRVGDEQ